jgi:hypothetical protein
MAVANPHGRCHLCRQRYTSRGDYTLVQWYARFASWPADASCCTATTATSSILVQRPGQTTSALLPGPIQYHLPKLAASTPRSACDGAGQRSQ